MQVTVKALYDDLAEIIAGGYGDLEVRVAARVMRDVPKTEKYPPLSWPAVTLEITDNVMVDVRRKAVIINAMQPMQRDAQEAKRPG